MGKKRKATDHGEEDEEPQPLLDPSQVEGFWQEFGPSLEHLSTQHAIVVVVLDRLTGEVVVDDSLSTPAESWYALSRAEQQHALTNVEVEDD